MLLPQVVEPLVMRHDPLQGAVAGIGVGLAAIEARDRPGGARDLVVDCDHDHAPCLLAIGGAAQLGGDEVLDFHLGLGELFHAAAFPLAIEVSSSPRKRGAAYTASLL